MRSILPYIFMVLAIIITGCGSLAYNKSNTAYEVTDMSSVDKVEEARDEKERKFLNKLGINPDFYDDLNLVLVFKKFHLFEEDMSKKEVLEVLDFCKNSESYDKLTVWTDIFSQKQDGVFDTKSAISKVGIKYQTGNEPETIAVFDFQKMEMFNGEKESVINNSQLEKITSMLKECDVENWEHHYEGKDDGSTGCMSWQLVIMFEDGGSSKYEGYYFGDDSNQPEKLEDILSLCEIA